MDAGIPERHIFVLGKPYSTVPQTAAHLRAFGCRLFQRTSQELTIGYYADRFSEMVASFWQFVKEELSPAVTKVIVLDEGGWLRKDIPQKLIERHFMVAIEHTMSGLFTMPARDATLPVLLMAASAAKTCFENHVIAYGIVKRLYEVIDSLNGKRIGIVGLGNIGRAVAARLHSQGANHLYGYDIHPEKLGALCFVRSTDSTLDLVSQCDVLLGCTGRDCVDPRYTFHSVTGMRWLASCSSSDVEFRRTAMLLGQDSSQNGNPFGNLYGKIGSAEIVLLNGGYPLNFDRLRELEHPVLIQLTRELTYAGVLQAALCEDSASGNGGLMLDPDVQRRLVQTWLSNNTAAKLFPEWLPPHINWWAENSEGLLPRRPLADLVTIGSGAEATNQLP